MQRAQCDVKKFSDKYEMIDVLDNGNKVSKSQLNAWNLNLFGSHNYD